MLDVHKDDQRAIEVALHYAKQINNDFATKFFSSIVEIKTKEDAEIITRFYWEMVDQAVEDEESGAGVEGISDFQFWMEKLMNILMGYLKRLGFYDTWNDISDEVNGR